MLPHHNKALDPLLVPRVLVMLGGSGSTPPGSATPQGAFGSASQGSAAAHRQPVSEGVARGTRWGGQGLRGSLVPPCTNIPLWLTGHWPGSKVTVVPGFAFDSPRRAGDCPQPG